MSTVSLIKKIKNENLENYEKIIKKVLGSKSSIYPVISYEKKMTESSEIKWFHSINEAVKYKNKKLDDDKIEEVNIYILEDNVKSILLNEKIILEILEIENGWKK